MSNIYTENTYEYAIIELLQNMGYRHVYAPNIERDYTCALYLEELENALISVNPTLPKEAIDEAIRKLISFENAELVQKNMLFTKWLQQGIELSYYNEKEKQSLSAQVFLIDYKNTENNSFIVANQ